MRHAAFCRSSLLQAGSCVPDVTCVHMPAKVCACVDGELGVTGGYLSVCMRLSMSAPIYACAQSRLARVLLSCAVHVCERLAKDNFTYVCM